MRRNRDKAVAILTRVWVTTPEELWTLRNEGLDLLRQTGRGRPDAGALVHVHGGLSLLRHGPPTRPGGCWRLQGTAAAAQIQRRLRERLGERETVARAARRVQRAFIDWGVLLETGKKGLYRGAAEARRGRRADHRLDPEGHALGRGRRAPTAIRAASRPPRLFPFEIPLPSTAELEACGAFEIVRHGLDHDVLLGLAGAALNCDAKGRT